MQEVSLSYDLDPVAAQLLTELIALPGSKPHFSLSQGVIRYDHKIYVGKGTNLRLKIFQTLHLSPLGGHPGQQRRYRLVKGLFYWPNMKVDIIQWVSECDTCQKTKTENVLFPGHLQPLPIPSFLGMT